MTLTTMPSDVPKPLAEFAFSPEHRAAILRARKLNPQQRKRLLQLAQPRIVDPYIAHIPHPKQQVFLSLSSKEEVMFGGAAGGGKSDAVLMSALQYVDVPGYSALILRRTWPDLNAAGAILDRARTWLSPTDAKEKDGGRVWVFPSGARLSFGYIQHDKDVLKFQSAEFQFVGFDELTHFSQKQYEYMFSRIRRPNLACINCETTVRLYSNRWKHTKRAASRECKNLVPDPMVLMQYSAAPDGTNLFNVPLRMRSATNPGGPGHDWVRAHFIDPNTRSGDALFIPSKLTDNPSLDQESYEKNLGHLGATDKQRLLDGDWDVTEEGETFERHWFNVVQDVPQSRYTCRYWDMAASEAPGADYTVGAKVTLFDGRWFIDDIIRFQGSPSKVEATIKQTADLDGKRVPIRIEQEGGSAGLHVMDYYRRNVLVGYNFDGVRPTGSKTARALPWAVAAENSNVSIKAAPWNTKFLDEVTKFPVAEHDDQVDAVSGAVEYLAHGRTGRLIV